MGSLLVVALVAGCAHAPVPPIYVDPDFGSKHFDTVTILPIVDRRVDKSTAVNVLNLRGPAAKALEKKGYRVDVPGTFADGREIPNQEVAEMEARDLAKLGPENAQVLLVVFLDDASGKTALGYSFKSEATAMLVEKSSGAMLWKDKGISSQGQGGLVGCMMAGAIKSDALNASVRSSLTSFPKHPSASR